MVSHAINVGKAFASVILELESWEFNEIHFHTNGTSVFNFIQQQISFPLHFVHIHFTFVYHGLHVHMVVRELDVQLTQEVSAKVKFVIDNITNQNNSANNFLFIIWFG